MAYKTPIYSLAKELGINSNRVISACISIGIPAKGAAKRLNEEELKKVRNYFETGKNVSEETVEIKKRDTDIKNNNSKTKKEKKTNFFPNRLIAKY